MLKRWNILTSLVAAVTLVGCGMGLPGDVAKLGYVNRPQRFAMDLPPGWTTQESTGVATIIVMAPDTGAAGRPNINVVAEPARGVTALEPMVKLCKQQVATFRGFQLISEEPRTLADGTKAYAVTFRHEAFEKPLMQRQMYVLAGGKMYTVTATAAVDAFAAQEPNFEIGFRSFRAGW